MMKVRFYLNDNGRISSLERAIWCYVREYDDTLAINTGESIKPELWDKETYRANPKKTKDKITKGALLSMNHYLNSFENKVYEIVRSIRMKDPSAGFSKVADELKNQFDRREIDFFSVYDEFLAVKKPQVTKASITKLKRVRGLLLEYEKRLTFEKITPLFFDKFYTFLVIEKQMINNTANKNISFFKTFLIWANVNGYTDNTSYQTFRSKTEQNEVIYLTEDELMTLYNLELENERLERVRDLFVFQCFTGARFSDVKNFKREDIDGATWKLRTQKTHQSLEIPLSGYAISILAKYLDFPQPLPVISNQKANKYIKELCQKAKINEPVKIIKYKGKERVEEVLPKHQTIGTHTARRTFISLSLRKGMKPDVIMAITGHKTYRMMQRYLRIADDHKREEMDKVWGSTLRSVK